MHDRKQLLDIIEKQNEALEKLIAERAQLRAQLEALGDKRDALSCLQRVYNNPEETPGNRIKAAAAAIGFERPKMSIAVQIGPSLLGERLDNAKVIDADRPALPAA